MGDAAKIEKLEAALKKLVNLPHAWDTGSAYVSAKFTKRNDAAIADAITLLKESN